MQTLLIELCLITLIVANLKYTWLIEMESRDLGLIKSSLKIAP